MPAQKGAQTYRSQSRWESGEFWSHQEQSQVAGLLQDVERSFGSEHIEDYLDGQEESANHQKKIESYR